MKTARCIALAISFWCAPGVFAEEVPDPVAEGGMRQPLTFLDSRLFDSRLSKELGSGRERVEVEVSGKVSLSAIPPRLDKWVTKVGEEGSVELREGPGRTRAIFSLLPLIFSAFQHASEERMLEPARDYNATILYRRDANGDTLIDRIVFTRRPRH